MNLQRALIGSGAVPFLVTQSLSSRASREMGDR